MKLAGKSREEIHAALADKPRAELLDLICKLATVEQLLRPSEIAALSRVRVQDVRRDIREGKMGEYYRRAANALAVPTSGVNTWRRAFRVSV